MVLITKFKDLVSEIYEIKLFRLAFKILAIVVNVLWIIMKIMVEFIITTFTLLVSQDDEEVLGGSVRLLLLAILAISIIELFH